MASPIALDDEQRADAGSTFSSLVRRLSRQSVDKHFSCYEDIAWDEPDHAIGPDDARCQTFPFDPLVRTAWYEQADEAARSRVGLHRIAACMKVGWHFENLLQRGLLAHAMTLENGAPEFRYLHHEIIEESNHSMMFQELVDRSGLDVSGMPWRWRTAAALVVEPIAVFFPSLFFVLVLGGEDPIDHMQRLQLRSATATHPLVERIMRIHVTEEARHISFARQYLRTNVPELGRIRRTVLSVATPVVLAVMTRMMVDPPRQLTRSGVPARTILQSRRTPEAKQLRKDAISKLRRFAGDVGLVNPVSRLTWRVLGLWDEPVRAGQRAGTAQ